MSETLSPLPQNPETPNVGVGTPLTPMPTKESNEVFLGGMIIMVLCLLLVLLTGTFGYFGYRLWQSSQVTRSTPSIQELGEKMGEKKAESTATPSTSEPAPTTPATTPSTPETASVDKTAVEVKVLNGGGAKGSASTLTELLKKAGYTKATFGNATADHTGTTIYHSTDATKAAELIKEEVMKTYPKATLMPATAGDKDKTAASVVVILGKE